MSNERTATEAEMNFIASVLNTAAASGCTPDAVVLMLLHIACGVAAKINVTGDSLLATTAAMYQRAEALVDQETPINIH